MSNDQRTPEEFFNRLQDYYNNDKNAEAEVYIKNLIRESQDTNSISEFYFYLGRIYYYNNEYEKAEESFTISIEHNISHFYSMFYLARINEMYGKYQDAIRLYFLCLKQRPDYTQISDFVIKLCYNINCSNNISLLEGKLNKTLIEQRKNKPKISIIVLCYNKLEYTIKCISSLFKNTKYENFEVVILDNASVDDTPSYLETFNERIKFVHTGKNLGFVGGNNFASKYADGEYLVFLNNDTEPREGWLEALQKTFEIFPDTGIAGAKLIYANNLLQEAGGIIFNDASGWNYGKMQDPQDPRYRFMREVDYCSGAALMIRKELFDKLGGFDTWLAPAYYEDTDLCFSVRKLGYKVRYCPHSVVIHHEGITNGTELNTGYKRYQTTNRIKFYEKWKDVLKQQMPNDPKLLYQSSNRNKSKYILIIDDWPPLPDKASGARKMYLTLKQMISMGYKVTYCHLIGKDIGTSASKYMRALELLGVEMIWLNYETWWAQRNDSSVNPILDNLIASLELEKRKPDFIYICFWWVANYFIDRIRKVIPKTPILIDTVDVHYLREEREAELLNDTKLKQLAKENKKKELKTYEKADCITTVTEKDKEILQRELKGKPIFIMSNIHDPVPTLTKFEDRKDILFVGNFNHRPNEDAVLYFIHEIFPKIKSELPDVKFYVVGNNPTEKIKNIASEDIIVTGWVPETKPYIEQCRISVVPLRYGAGVKGKVGENFECGLPMVLTTIAAEGMDIVNEEHAYISDDPSQFAKYSVELYRSKAIWDKFSNKGKELLTNKFSSEVARKRIKRILSFESRNSFNSKLTPRISIVIVTYNQYEYTEKCLQSVQANTKSNYEIIIVDNNSSDNTINGLNKFQNIKLIKNKENVGFTKAANQGIKAAGGEYILLLNNDIIVTENWLERMIDVAESNHAFGVVGPISNQVSGVQIDKNAKYDSIEEMHKYAAKIKKENAGKYFEFPRVAFLCTLIKREVIDKIGGLDERFSPGNFEDDDFCLRVELAGYKTVIAQDVFIHHYGSKSFKANGVEEYAKRLEQNKQIFIDKWGADPEEIWLKKKTFRRRNPAIPIDANPFIESMKRAMIYLSDKDTQQAVIYLNEAIENYDKYPKAEFEQLSLIDLLNLAGNASLMDGNLEKAQEYFGKELEINQTSSRACVGLGEVFSAAELFAESKTMYEWAVKNDPTNGKAREGLKKINTILKLDEEHNSLE
jgi:O-antigen biosynthesis protein